MKEENKNINRSKTFKFLFGIITGVLLASSITVNTIQAINISKLNKNIDSSTQKISNLDDVNQQLESTIVTLNDEVKTKENRIKVLTKEVEQLSNDKETNAITIQTLNAQIEQIKGEIVKLNQEIKNKEKQIEDLYDVIDSHSGGSSSVYSVIYIAEGSIVNTYNVESGGSVSTPPAVPDKIGYTGAWATTATNITSNTIINAVYTPSTYSLNYDLHFFNENISGKMVSVYTGTNTKFEFVYDPFAGGLELKFRLCLTLDVTSSSFVFKGITYTIGSTQVNNGSGTPINITGEEFKDDGYTFTLIDSRSKVECRFDNGGDYVSFSYNDIFVFANYFYRLSKYDQKIYNASDNTVVATLAYYSDSYLGGLGRKYYPSTKQYISDDDPTDIINVNADNTFTYGAKTYKFLLSSLRVTEYTTVVSEWIDSSIAPSISNHNCGEQLMIKSIRTNVKSTTADGSSKITTTGEMGYHDPETMYIDCDPRTEFAYIKEDIFLINPIGNITIFMMFDIGHI